MSNDNAYVIRASDATNVLTANRNGNTTVGGNLDVDTVLTLKTIPGVSDTSPLVIINDSPGGGTGVVHQSTASGQGFIIAYITAQSSVAWEEGGKWGGSNEFTIKSGSNGLTIKPTGDTTISGNLNVVPSQAQSIITTCFNHAGSSGYMMLGGRYGDQGFLHFETDYQYGEMFLIVRRLTL